MTAPSPDELARVGPTHPLDALVSYHYYKDDATIGPLVATGRLRMIGDSGAFSALTSGHPIKLPEFVAWVKRWGPHLAWVAALDVIGDPVATLKNWRTMRDTHGLDVVPTIHVGADPRCIEPYVRDGVDFFGLGGMVGRALQSLPWLVKMFRYVRDRHPEVRFHLWGMTNRKVLDNLPAYSADSSGFGAGHRFARFSIFDPRKGHIVNVRMMRNDVYGVAPLLRDFYGVRPEWVLRPTRENRALVMQIYARSYQLYAEWLQARHKVSPPRWGLNNPFPTPTPVDGTRIHAVTARSGHGGVDDLRRAVGDDDHAGPPGTRIHAVEMSDQLLSTVSPLNPDHIAVLSGTRVHAVERDPKHLAAAVSTLEDPP